MALNAVENQRWSIILWVFSTFFYLTLTDRRQLWKYGEGVSKWSEPFPMCGDFYESPIELSVEASEIHPPTPWNTIRTVGYDDTAPFNFTNTGRTLRMYINYDPYFRPFTIDQNDGVLTTYELMRTEFHWPSEHVIEGTRYNLEMQMIHRQHKSFLFLVWAFVFKICDRASPGWDMIASDVEYLKKVGGRIVNNGWQPSAFVYETQNHCSFFKYVGSLTSPLCYRNTTWFVVKEPYCLTHAQMESFLAVLNDAGLLMIGNIRPLQRRNNRFVEFIDDC